MYASPRYSRHHGGSYAVSYSPSKYYQPQEEARHQAPPPQAYSPPLKSYARYDYYGNQQHAGSPTYYHQQQQQQQQEYYHSGSSTASSSQDGYYGDDLDDMEEYGNPELTTVPTVPTPMTLSKYELGKTPSGRVLVTQGHQTVEFFSGVVNAPLSRCVFVQE